MTHYFFHLAESDALTELRDLAERCEHDVTIESSEGDKFSLKSTLGQFIVSLLLGREPERSATYRLHCIGEHDRALFTNRLGKPDRS